MKTAYLILLLAVSNIVYSQDFRNPKPVINPNDTLLANSTDKMIKAWNWNSLGRRLDSAMLINFYHRNIDWNAWNMPVNLPYQLPNNQWTLQAFGPTYASELDGIGGGDRFFAMLQAPAIEPQASINNSFNNLWWLLRWA